MSFLGIPDVQTMFHTFFPGSEIVGEAVTILKDSYLFFSRHVDPTEGGRAMVLALLSLVMTIGLMVQRRLGNTRTLMSTGLWALAKHGSMVSIFGASWFVYPALDHVLRNGNVSGLVILMSLISIVVGWGRDCVPGMSGFRQRMSGRWGFGETPDSPWGWSFVFFGVIFLCFGLALLRCV